MAKPITWVLVADAARARVFRIEEPGPHLVPALDRELIATNLPTHDLVSDRPGRHSDAGGQGRHTMDAADPHRLEKRRFAHEVAAVLDEERKKHAFERLIVAAAPQLLGDLRAEMSDDLKRMVEAEIAKDFSKLPVREIEEHLAGALQA
jgi:protein required for attachment to host cells